MRGRKRIRGSWEEKKRKKARERKNIAPEDKGEEKSSLSRTQKQKCLSRGGE